MESLLEFLIDSENKTPIKLIVHSMNPVGRENIESYLNNYNKTLKNE